jgi:hypothetical protein
LKEKLIVYLKNARKIQNMNTLFANYVKKIIFQIEITKNTVSVKHIMQKIVDLFKVENNFKRNLMVKIIAKKLYVVIRIFDI